MNQTAREGFLPPPAGEVGEAETLARPDEVAARSDSRKPEKRAERPEPRRREPEPATPDEPPAEDAQQERQLSNVWPITVRLLYKPIRNQKNELVHELTFREPTGADINRYGNPVRLTADDTTVFDERKMSMMISTLAGVHHPFIEAMDPRDWNSCAYRLRLFFIPNTDAWFPA